MLVSLFFFEKLAVTVQEVLVVSKLCSLHRSPINFNTAVVVVVIDLFVVVVTAASISTSHHFY